MNQTMPHAKFIIAISLILLAGFTGVTFWVLIYSEDATTKGSIIQTWNNLVIAVGSFWLGSSLGGKIGLGGTQEVKVRNQADEPVPIQEAQ